MPSSTIKLHAQIEVLPAAGLLTSWLANYWLGKVFSVGQNYMDYVRKGTQDIDLKFLQASNDGANHVYGFDKYEIPTVAFHKYVDAYIFCMGENRKHAVNAPFDTARSLEESAQWRKDFVPKIQRNDDFDGDAMNDSMKKLLETLTESLSLKKREETKQERIEAIEFVVAEIKPRLTLCMSQMDKIRGFAQGDVNAALDNHYNLIPDHEGYVDADILDELMSEDDQDRLLGDCYRRGDVVTREGLRGTYAVATANLKRAMYNDESRRALSGVYYDTMLSWVALMRLGRETSTDDKE